VQDEVNQEESEQDEVVVLHILSTAGHCETFTQDSSLPVLLLCLLSL